MIIPKLTFAFLLFLSSFISLKSVGTEEMTILHSFLAFLTISHIKMYHEVCKSRNMHISFIQLASKLNSK